jgi:hypothetical protein
VGENGEESHYKFHPWLRSSKKMKKMKNDVSSFLPKKKKNIYSKKRKERK